MVVALWHKPKYLRKVLLAAAVVAGSCALFSEQSKFFRNSLHECLRAARVRRMRAATEGDVNDVLMNRVLAGMFYAVQNAPNLPFFGYGLGMGTNAGAVLLTGSATFLISEEEWGRVIGEMGLLMGFIVIIIRVVFSLSILKKCIQHLRSNNPLPWMLISFGFMQILQGQWGQPTNLYAFPLLAVGWCLRL